MSVKLCRLAMMTAYIAGASLTSGCVLDPPVREVVREVCYERSDFRDKEFAYPCSDRDKAAKASGMCGLLGETARSLVALNRRIGPTTTTRLLKETKAETVQVAEVLHGGFGEELAKTYVYYVALIGDEISQRNITDLISYPDEQFSVCLGAFDYKPRP